MHPERFNHFSVGTFLNHWHRHRKRLLDLVQIFLTDADTLADVYFDAEDQGQENFSPQAKVIYSGEGGHGVRNRADWVIIDFLGRQRPEGNIARVIVTNDRELSTRCQILGAKVIQSPGVRSLFTGVI